MAEIGKAFLRYFACFVLGAIVACAGLWFLVVLPGDRLAREGARTIIELEGANGKLSLDLASARSDARDLAQRLDDRQRVINKIDASVRQLGSGLSGSIETIDDIIRTVQSVVDILRNG